MIDTNKLIYSSLFSGFSNNGNIPFSASFGGGSISAHGYKKVSASAPLPASDNITQIIFQLDGIESFYRLLNGVTQVDYPQSSTRTYSIETFSYRSGGKVYVDCYVINQSSSSWNAPSFTLRCLASTFVAPF